MNLTVSTPETRKHQASINRNRSIERFGLIGAIAVLLLGVLFLYAAKKPGLDADQKRLDAGRVVHLNAVRDPSEVLPAVAFISSEADRQSAAQRIYEVVEGSGGRLPRIGVLSSIGTFTSGDIREIKQNAVVRTPGEFLRSLILYVLLFIVSFSAVHLVWWKLNFRGDGVLLPAIALLCALGFVMMVSIREPLRDTLSAAAFVQGVAAGCVLMLLVSLVNFQKSQLRRLAFVPLLVSFLLSVLLFVRGSAPGSSDARINLFGFQPVEAIKLLLVLFLAGYFAEHWELIRELRQKPPRALAGFSRWIKLPPMHYVLPIAVGMAMALLFFVFQKDLGPGLIVSLLFLVYYGVARRKTAVVALGFLAIVGAFWLATFAGVSRTVATRVEMWQSPWRNFAPAGGDHLAHSLWALASGGIAGTGLGLGSPELVREISTDFILAGIGEELGFAGTLSVLFLYALLLFRAMRILRRSPGDYAFFLCLGMTTITALQILLISGGVLGLVPLSGVTTPFLSYGRSSLLATFCVFGVILSVSNHRSESTDGTQRFAGSVKALGVAVGLGLALIAAAAFNVQVLRADAVAAEAALAFQADRHHRLTYNPRLLQAAARIPRGSIYDRNGIPLATGRRKEIEDHREAYKAMGIDVESMLSGEDTRYYPFGGAMFHLLGDARTEINWKAGNTSYIERDDESHLRGFDDRAEIEEMTTPSGEVIEVERRDYTALVPLLRYAHRPSHPAVRDLLNNDRDLHTSIDARLQTGVAEALRAEILRTGKKKGAAVVIDPANGDVLASVSYPWPEDQFDQENQLDRSRYGLYPPGSTFKLVTAMAALDKSPALANQKFFCRSLGGGRVGNVIPGYDRPIRDDVRDTHAHGEIDLAQGLVVSCNAYYAQLGVRIGSDSLYEMASELGIVSARPNSAKELRRLLPQASYGQGEVLATPFQMARLVAAIANAGNMPMGRWVTDARNKRTEPARQVVSVESAAFLARTMRLVVTSGTGARARNSSVAIAGKTGTAEVANGVSHSWFIGFAPYEGPQKIAFAVIVENGGYGGMSAASLAVEIVDQAKTLKLIH